MLVSNIQYKPHPTIVPYTGELWNESEASWFIRTNVKFCGKPISLQEVIGYGELSINELSVAISKYTDDNLDSIPTLKFDDLIRGDLLDDFIYTPSVLVFFLQKDNQTFLVNTEGANYARYMIKIC